jgi:cytochrome P450
MTTMPAYDPLNPFPMYKFLRETYPVFRHPAARGWQVFRYNDVLKVLNAPTTFSSNVFGASQDKAAMAESLVHLDPPRHRHMRALVNQVFTPKRVAQLEQRIVTIANELLDAVEPMGTMDFIADFASPLPVIVIAELLGIPAEDRAHFRRWSDALLATPTEGGIYQQPELYEYIQAAIEQRRKEPGDDLISQLISAQIEGESLSMREILGFCVLLLVAGNETTMNLLGNSLLCFEEHPEAWEELSHDPSLLPSAIEEVLRYRSPVQFLARVASVDTTIGGEHIQAGELITLCLGSANRDEAEFANPEVFDMGRSPNRHLAFGHSIHFCLGAPLARLEANIGLSLLLQRLSDIRVASNESLEPVSMGFLGVRALPVTFHACD